MIPSNLPTKILHFDSVDSTNKKAKEFASTPSAEGTVVVAEHQHAGRGRGNRVWHSPKGGLYLSILLRPNDPKRSNELSILVGAGLAQAVTQLLPKSVDVSVKWPNDILVNWKKVGGILCEAIEGEKCVVVGIGLNVNIPGEQLSPFLKNPFSATSFSVEVDGVFDLKQVTDVILAKVFSLYGLYHTEGFKPIQYLWEKNCRLIGKKIELREMGWREFDNKASGVGMTTGTCLGIDDSGGIVLSNQRGERMSYTTGEISCFWP